MSEERRGQHDSSPHRSDAGAPVGHADKQPSHEELDERNRSMARPRRAAGPPLQDESSEAALRDALPHNPPPPTDPISGAMLSPQDVSTHAGNAGLPINHAGPKPSHDELDRRNSMMAAPRKAAGPPLHDSPSEAAMREASAHEPPPPTDPMGS
jgi:hypothetical protein